VASGSPSVTFRTRIPVVLFALITVGVLYNSFVGVRAFIAEGSHLELLTGIGSAVCGIWFIVALLYRARPIVEIAGCHVRYQSVLWLRRSTIDLRDVSQVGEVSPFLGRLRLGLRSGKAVHIYLSDLKPTDRKEVVRLIRERVDQERSDV
jgi:hypothetical protein